MSRFFTTLAVAVTLLLSALGCDELNKPIRPLHNRPPRPAPSATAVVDAGEAGAPTPALSAEPGDVHL